MMWFILFGFGPSVIMLPFILYGLVLYFHTKVEATKRLLGDFLFGGGGNPIFIVTFVPIVAHLMLIVLIVAPAWKFLIVPFYTNVLCKINIDVDNNWISYVYMKIVDL